MLERNTEPHQQRRCFIHIVKKIGGPFANHVGATVFPLGEKNAACSWRIVMIRALGVLLRSIACRKRSIQADSKMSGIIFERCSKTGITRKTSVINF